MKAIPLIACLALVAAQGRAQNTSPADAAVSGQTKLAGEIESWRKLNDPLPSEFEQRLKPIVESVNAARSADQLDKTKTDFKTLQDDLLARKQPAAGPNGALTGNVSRNQARMQDFKIRIDPLVFARNGGIFYDGMKRTGLETNPAPGRGPGTAGMNAGVPSSIVNAPALPSGLRTDPVPSPSGSPLPPPVIAATDLPAWVSRIGISGGDYDVLKNAPVVPAMPSPDKPSSLTALDAWIDRDGISAAIIGKLQKIKAVGGDLLDGFGGYCYYGVKWMLTMVLPGVQQPKDLDLPQGDAYKMLLALRKNPKLLAKLHLFPLDLKTVPFDQADLLPERTLLIWNRGCAGFSAESGHIEFTLHADKMPLLSATAFYPLSRKYGFWAPSLDPKTQVLACSDGCEVQSMKKLRLYAGKCLSAYVPVVAPLAL